MTSNQITAAVGLVLLILWAVGPQLWKLGKLVLRRKPATIPYAGQSLQDAVIQLRYYMALQAPDVREQGQAALDVLDSIVADQPRLPSPKSGSASNSGGTVA